MTNTMSTQTKITYRKTKDGEWVAYGPKSVIKADRDVTITKKDGSTKVEHIARVGRGFQVDGVEMVYGYITRDEPSPRYAPSTNRYGRGRKACITDGNCLSFGDGRNCGGYDCDGW